MEKVVIKGRLYPIISNFYHDPSIPQDQITYQYAVVPPDFNFPAGVEYTVLSDLVLTPYHYSLRS